jgi:hypothetical protein
MVQVQFSDHFWEEFEVLDQTLNAALQRLRTGCQKQMGLSTAFIDSIASKEEAAQLCAEAMEKLARDYVTALEGIRASGSPSDKLAALQHSEEIWSQEATLIQTLDADKTEASFLLHMRTLNLNFLGEELVEASDACYTSPSEENIALCIGLLMTMDHIYGELGAVLEAPERKRLRSIALTFKR